MSRLEGISTSSTAPSSWSVDGSSSRSPPSSSPSSMASPKNPESGGFCSAPPKKPPRLRDPGRRGGERAGRGRDRRSGSSARAGSGEAGSRSRRRILARRAIAPLDRAARSQRRPRGARPRADRRAAKPARGSAPSDGSSIVKSATPRTRGGVALETHLAPNILPGSFVEDALRVPPRWLRRERRAPEAVARQRRRFRAKEEMADYKKDHHAVTCRVARRDRRTRDVRLTSRVILGDCGRFS